MPEWALPHLRRDAPSGGEDERRLEDLAPSLITHFHGDFHQVLAFQLVSGDIVKDSEGLILSPVTRMEEQTLFVQSVPLIGSAETIQF